jgi:hypothetical protein
MRGFQSPKMRPTHAILFIATPVLAQVTLPPLTDLIVNNAIQTTAIEYSACLAAEAVVGYCYTALGGSASFELAPATAVNSCFCCEGVTPLSPLYGVCANYLRTEAPTLSTLVSGE